MKSGLLITFEGIDGSGKTSAAQAAHKALHGTHEVLLTREPGATELGATLRTIVQTQTVELSSEAEFLLFAADRAQHMKEIVLPALAAGKIVLSDRMADSSYAYQGYGRGVDPHAIQSINRWVMQGREPDVTFFLDLSFDEAQQRMRSRPERTAFEQEQREFFERVREGFCASFAQRSSLQRVHFIDASCSEQEVHRSIIDYILTLLPHTIHDSPSRSASDRS